MAKKRLYITLKGWELRRHLIKCGDLVNKFGSVIILEEDIYVSPVFYSYACEALTYYSNDDRIAGISLYTLTFGEGHKFPFTPIDDGSDVFFMQMAGSIGQVLTRERWNNFKNWYESNPDLSEVKGLSKIIKNWPEQSWKKYFVAYIILFDKYFVFPKKSYVTNFADKGTNMISTSFVLQVPLKLKKTNVRFISLDDALSVYDSFSEILPDRLNKFTDTLKDYDYEVDLYGRKESFSKDYILTRRNCQNTILTFDRNAKPHEMNIIMDLPGNVFSLAHKDDVEMNEQGLGEKMDDFTYFYTFVFNSSYMIKIILYRIISKWKRFFK
ncbi:MAG: hypothetical protein R2750_03575 [Bacteroidales bacterium]